MDNPDGSGGLVELKELMCAHSAYREEQEKLNVWVAFLNLENMYGSQESLSKVFERAVQYNEPLKVFLHLADIYTKSGKLKVGGWVQWPAAQRPQSLEKALLGVLGPRVGKTPVFCVPSYPKLTTLLLGPDFLILQ
jgi:hypothetical protein